MITLTLFSLKTHANSSDKKHYLLADITYSGGAAASLGYGYNLYSKKGAYFGLIEAAAGLAVVFTNLKDSYDFFSLGYGYEFMKDSDFPFGLRVSGEWGKIRITGKEGLKNRALIPVVGIFARTNIIEKWSVFLRIELAILMNTLIPALPTGSLGARYHF